jgi:hypothetical protein
MEATRYDAVRGRARRTWGAGAFFGSIFVGLAVLLWARERDPKASFAHREQFLGIEWDRYFNDDLLGLICAAAALGILVLLLLRRRDPAKAASLRPVARLGLAGLVLAASFVYFYGHRGIVMPGYPVLYDDFHYYTGAKYFDELGYFDLYDCVVEADRASKRTVALDLEIRDLHTYGYMTAEDALRRTDCEAQFGPDRWQEFSDDIDFFVQRTSRKFLPHALRDRGYNGTPFHTWLAGRIANLRPASHDFLLWSSLIDVVAILSMMVLLVRSFGWTFGLLFALFFFTNFADRYWFIGGGFCRYLWMATLGSGIAMLEERRHLLAGLLLAFSAMLSAFPLFFVAGVGVKVLFGWLRKRAVTRPHRRFLAGFALGAVLAGGLSVSHGSGAKNYPDFLQDMGIHSDLITVSRVGFRYDFLFRGEVYEDDPPYAGNKRRELRMLSPLIYGLGFAFVGLAAWVSTRLNDTRATILVGYSIFFFLFGTVEYYYACGALVMLLWRGPPAASSRPWLIWLPFPLMALTYLAWHETQFVGFCNNTMMSWSITIHLVAALVYFARRTGVWEEIGERLRRRAELAGETTE